MAGVIVPVAKPLILCEEVDREGGLLNVYGLFDALNAASFPHTRDHFGVFVQLSGGLGPVPVRFEIVRAADGTLIHVSHLRTLAFDRRSQLMQLMMGFDRITFPAPGVYLVELYCDNTWVADVTLELLGGE